MFTRQKQDNVSEKINHLSNTLVTISDNKIGVDEGTDNTADFYEARVLSATDYYAFGMAMKERSFQSESYRYGYQGSEKNEEFESSYTTEYRQLNVKISRWVSIDPKATAYESPYVSMGNNPIFYNDPAGDIIRFHGGSREDRRLVKELLRLYARTSPTAKSIIRNLKNSENIHIINLVPAYGGVRLIHKSSSRINFELETIRRETNGLISTQEKREILSIQNSSYQFVISNAMSQYMLTGQSNYNDANGHGDGSDMYIAIESYRKFPTTVQSVMIKFLHELLHQHFADNGQADLASYFGYADYEESYTEVKRLKIIEEMKKSKKLIRNMEKMAKKFSLRFINKNPNSLDGTLYPTDAKSLSDREQKSRQTIIQGVLSKIMSIFKR